MTVILREDIAFCIANRRVALLDIRAERYFCLPNQADAAFQDLVIGNAPTDLSRTGPLAPLFDCGYLLEQAGIISTIKSPDAYPVATKGFDTHQLSTSFPMFVVALASQLRTLTFFKTQSFSQLIYRLRRRKETANNGRRPISFEKVSKPLTSFLATKLIISNQDRCLHRSVALIDFFALYGVYPDLVIGVRLAPFSFHAWVQADTVVLNDELDTVLPYTPILVV